MLTLTIQFRPPQKRKPRAMPSQAQYEATKAALTDLSAAVATDESNSSAVDTATAQLASAQTAKTASGSDVQAKLTAVVDAAVADGFSVTPSAPAA